MTTDLDGKLTPAALRPGDIMFGPIGGFVPGVVPVGVGQLALASRKDRLSWRRWWHVRHAGVIVEASRTLGPAVRDKDGRYKELAAMSQETVTVHHDATFYLTGVITAPRLVQAMPSGAEEIDLVQAKHWTAQHIYVRPEYVPGDPEGMPGHIDWIGQAETVASSARHYVGTPYGFLTYAALALHALTPGRERAISRYIMNRGEMICSQLVDQALTDSGFHVFKDGRLPQDVVPAELFRRLMELPGTHYCRPGTDMFWIPAQLWPGQGTLIDRGGDEDAR